jgi:hypothetical protein
MGIHQLRLPVRIVVLLFLFVPSALVANSDDGLIRLTDSLPGTTTTCPDSVVPTWPTTCWLTTDNPRSVRKAVDKAFREGMELSEWQTSQGVDHRRFLLGDSLYHIVLDRESGLLAVTVVDPRSCDEPEMKRVYAESGSTSSISPQPFGSTERQGRDLLGHPPAEYPQLARVARIEGRVILQGIWRPDGTLGNLCVLQVDRPNLGFEANAFITLAGQVLESGVAGDPVTLRVDFGLREGR